MKSSKTRNERFTIAIYHGEGDSIYHVIDNICLDGEDPTIILSFSNKKEKGKAYYLAIDYCHRHNFKALRAL